MARYIQLVEKQEVFCSFASREILKQLWAGDLVSMIASGLSAYHMDVRDLTF
jgi:hypothetical protein